MTQNFYVKIIQSIILYYQLKLINWQNLELPMIKMKICKNLMINQKKTYKIMKNKNLSTTKINLFNSHIYKIYNQLSHQIYYIEWKLQTIYKSIQF